MISAKHLLFPVAYPSFFQDIFPVNKHITEDKFQPGSLSYLATTTFLARIKRRRHMEDKHLTQPPVGELLMFTSGDGKVRIDCRFESDTLWLSQAMICKLYGKAKATISEHIKNIFAEYELDENAVVRFYRTTASDGKNYSVQYFSLPLILAIGYRVRSTRGTQFRQCATQTLQEYLVKGFVMDDERLKNPPVMTCPHD